MMRFIKQYGVSILLLIVAIFCLFNIGQNIQDAFTVVTNSLALLLAVVYFVNFERGIIIKIKSFVLNIKWPFHGKTKKVLTNVLNLIVKKRWDIISYLFLFLLLIITLGQFSYLERFINLSWINKYQVILTVLAILSGGLTFWHNRERVEKEIDQEQIAEQGAEDKRKADFASKFPRINKVPVLRNLVRWMYKEGWGYSVSVIFLLIIGFIIRIYNLGKLSLWWDELITGTYVTRILEIGTPLFPSELGYYWRGVAYHYFVSLFTFVFGNNEFWLRFPSVLFGMGIVLMAFVISKKINKKVALLVLLFLIFSSYNIEYSRFARFYIMNSFLFILGIWVFWKGYFEDKLKYKLISLFLFFLMLHTVQFGVIYISLIITWFLFFGFKLIKNSKTFFEILKKNVLNIFLLFTTLIIYKLGNIFEKFIKIEIDYNRAIDVVDVAQPINWDYFQYPSWYLINFFNNNYFPIILIYFSVIISVYFFIKNKNNNQKFISFINILLLTSIFIYEIGSRGVNGARIFLYSEALIVISFIISIYYLIALFFKNKKLKFVLCTTMIMIIFFNITPLFYKRLSMDYGDKVSDDPFRSTHVADFRADYKTTSEYIANNIKKNDIVITVMHSNYFYLKRNPDYILNQNIRWNTLALVNNSNDYVDQETGGILINESSDIDKIISKNIDKNVYLLVNGGSIDILSTTHIRSDFVKFIDNNLKHEVFKSQDGLSRVLLFSALDK